MKQFVILFCAIFGLVSLSFSQNRSLSEFHSVSNSTGFDLVLQNGSTHSVTLEVSGVDTEKIKTEVKNGELKISKSGGWNWKDRPKGKIYVTYRNLDEIKNSGSGDIECDSPIRGEKLRVSCSGSGDIELDKLEVDALDIGISGSADLDLDGSAKDVSVRISGSGDVDALDLSAEDVTVAISGSGDVKITASNSISAKISGSGSVSYKGEPGSVEKKISGSGSVKPI